MFKRGINHIDGIPIEVTRKRIRRINIRIGPDGLVHLSVPRWWATLAEGEAFLRSNWKWVVEKRQSVMSRPSACRRPITQEERAALLVLLGAHGESDGLMPIWAARLNEPGVSWKLRTMKSQWGSCNWRKRLITLNAELARMSRELVEYVVVHEFTHLQVHDHGPHFKALMDVRLPGWRQLRSRLAHVICLILCFMEAFGRM